MENRVPNYILKVEKGAVAFSKGIQMFFLSILFYIAILINFNLLEIEMTSTITLLIATILMILVVFEIIMAFVKENREINFYEYGISELTNKGENLVDFSQATAIKLKRTVFDTLFGTAHISLGKKSFGPIKKYKETFEYAKKLFDYYKFYQTNQQYQTNKMYSNNLNNQVYQNNQNN